MWTGKVLLQNSIYPATYLFSTIKIPGEQSRTAIIPLKALCISGNSLWPDSFYSNANTISVN